MKKTMLLGILTILSMTLVACSQEENKEVVKDEKIIEKIEKEKTEEGQRIDPNYQGIVAGNIETGIQIIEKQNKNIKVEYVLKSHLDTEKKFEFPTTQRYDYIIYKKDGEKITNISQFSEGMMFAEVIEEIVLKQGEEMKYMIEVNNLEKGNYVMEAWLTSLDESEYRHSLEFEIE